jgi:hypothetical protein
MKQLRTGLSCDNQIKSKFHNITGIARRHVQCFCNFGKKQISNYQQDQKILIWLQIHKHCYSHIASAKNILGNSSQKNKIQNRLQSNQVVKIMVITTTKRNVAGSSYTRI